MKKKDSVFDSTYFLFEENIKHYSLIPAGSKVLVGISGGVDSTVLIHFLKKYCTQHECSVIAGHLIHEWEERTEEEERELEVCKVLCKELNIPLLQISSSHITLPLYRAKKSKGSREALAREKRRLFLEKIAYEEKCSCIALAHHADDQLETFFIRLIRGTSLSGLSAIRHKNTIYIRPLLTLSKADLLKTAYEQKWTFHTDLSNTQETGLRNRIRKNLIPCLEKIDHRSIPSLHEALRKIQESNDALTYSTELFIRDTYSFEESILYIKELEKFPLYFQKEILTKILLYNTLQATITENLLKEILKFLFSSRPKSKKRFHNLELQKKNTLVAYISKYI